MYIIAAIDDECGMMFNRRRVSRDEMARKKILEITSGTTLYMSEYTAKQFSETELANQSVYIGDDFMYVAKNFETSCNRLIRNGMDGKPENCPCFVENAETLPYADSITGIVLIKWNRKYPSDFKLDLVPSAETGFVLVKTEEMAGKSHEKITVEYWKKEGERNEED